VSFRGIPRRHAMGFAEPASCSGPHGRSQAVTGCTVEISGELHHPSPPVLPARKGHPVQGPYLSGQSCAHQFVAVTRASVESGCTAVRNGLLTSLFPTACLSSPRSKPCGFDISEAVQREQVEPSLRRVSPITAFFECSRGLTTCFFQEGCDPSRAPLWSRSVPGYFPQMAWTRRASGASRPSCSVDTWSDA